MKIIMSIFAVLLSSCSILQPEDINYKVIIRGSELCESDYVEGNFCSEDSQLNYNKADKTINFDKDKVLVVPENNIGDIIVIDPSTNEVYPLEYLVSYDNLDFTKSSNVFCFDGEIIAYRMVDEGHICFEFKDKAFERLN